MECPVPSHLNDDFGRFLVGERNAKMWVAAVSNSFVNELKADYICAKPIKLAPEQISCGRSGSTTVLPFPTYLDSGWLSLGGHCWFFCGVSLLVLLFGGQDLMDMKIDSCQSYWFVRVSKPRSWFRLEYCIFVDMNGCKIFFGTGPSTFSSLLILLR